jgi:hypothetical protein
MAGGSLFFLLKGELMSVTVNSGEGWYEFFHPTKVTTHVAYVFTNGDIYLPEEGVEYDDFVLASARGQVYRLVREEDLAVHPISMDGKTES